MEKRGRKRITQEGDSKQNLAFGNMFVYATSLTKNKIKKKQTKTL